MNKNRMFVYELGRTPALPRRSAPIFRPTWSGELLHSMYEHRSSDGVVLVGSQGADFPYKFQVEDEQEFVLAFLYVVYKDNSSHGSFTQAAKAGKLVYSHSMYDRVRRWWARPDSLKYRGYRVDV